MTESLEGDFVGQVAEIEIGRLDRGWKKAVWGTDNFWHIIPCEGEFKCTCGGWRESVTAVRNRSIELIVQKGGEVRVTDPTTGGQKGRKPERYGLIPVWPLAEVARVYAYGAEKYSENNWRSGYAWTLSYDALQRHINAFWSGEETDESGLHHLAHAVFHLFALMHYSREGVGTDDRS